MYEHGIFSDHDTLTYPFKVLFNAVCAMDDMLNSKFAAVEMDNRYSLLMYEEGTRYRAKHFIHRGEKRDLEGAQMLSTNHLFSYIKHAYRLCSKTYSEPACCLLLQPY